jgi:hypothetical protein
MSKAGKRYPLAIYTRMLDRWWPPLFFMGLALMAVAWPFYQDLYGRLTSPWRWMSLAGLGALLIFVSLLMLILRKSAYVQAFRDYFRLATPFLRLNVSYRRVTRVSSASAATLFPLRRMSGLQRDIIGPLLSLTAVVIELNGWPLPRPTLNLFLSPFFFKDKTPHFVILVEKWMSFSTELESMRSGRETRPPAIPEQSSQSILTRLPRK